MPQSNPFTIVPAAAAKVIFLTQPASTYGFGALLDPIDVEVTDKYGNAVSGATVKLTLSSKRFSGVTTMTTDDTGVADFTTLWVSTAGTFKIKATSAKASANSKSFVVKHLPPSKW